MNSIHTLIVSDFHLGSPVSRSADLIELLKSWKFKKLILLGDVFESLNFDRLKGDDWKLLSLLARISQEHKVIWVEGNHDKGLIKLFGTFTGAHVHKKYVWNYQGKKYIAIHGHQFDNFMINNVFLSNVANQIYNFIQLIDFRDKRISRFIKRESKGWLKLSEKVAKRALLHAKLRGADFIFCGHTHKTLERKKGKTHYYNSGCWTDDPATFITLDNGKIKIREFQQEKIFVADQSGTK